MVAITEGRLDFGPWEQIYYAEFDDNFEKVKLMLKCFNFTKDELEHADFVAGLPAIKDIVSQHERLVFRSQAGLYQNRQTKLNDMLYFASVTNNFEKVGVIQHINK